MGITSTLIEMNFSEAKRQAAELEDIAESLRTLSSGKIDEASSQINAEWKGNSASAFLGKVQTLSGNINETAKELDEIAISIKQTAQRVYDAEMEAVRIAEQRVSGGGVSGGGSGGGSGGSY